MYWPLDLKNNVFSCKWEGRYWTLEWNFLCHALTELHSTYILIQWSDFFVTSRIVVWAFMCHEVIIYYETYWSENLLFELLGMSEVCLLYTLWKQELLNCSKEKNNNSLKVSVRLTKTGQNCILLSITGAVKSASKVASIFYVFFCMTCKNFWNGNYKGSDLSELFKKTEGKCLRSAMFYLQSCSIKPFLQICLEDSLRRMFDKSEVLNLVVIIVCG